MKKNNDPSAFTNMSLISHLSDLRVVVVNILWGLVIGFFIAYQFTEPIFDIIRHPIAPYLPQGGLVFTGPIDKFFAHIRIAFFSGFVISSPWWLYQIWRFVSPGLYKKEKQGAFYFILIGTLLFLTGVLFTYFGVFPMAFKFLMSYGGDIDKPMITIDQYLGFFVWTSLSFGAAFEMPLILVTLGLFGIVTKNFLSSNRRYAISILAVLSAVITPPDIVSMLLMLTPMWFLYEISIIMVGFFETRKA